MKKISLLALGLVAGLTVSAQPDVVKNAEGLLKSKKYQEALEAVKPALSNPETSETAAPWFIAGKASQGLWDDAFVAIMTGQQLPEDQTKAACHNLLDAYNYYVKALPLDSKPDAKGKVKQKYTKEIRKTIGENYKGYFQAGLDLYNNKDYPGAYEAWDLYVNLPQNANADQKAFVADADTIVGQIAFYQALAAYLEKNFENSLLKVNQALDKGYKDRDLFIVGIEAADSVKDEAAQSRLAAEGNANYGSYDISFLASIVNAQLQKENYPACYEAINQSMNIAANDSIKSLLYNITAIINEREGKIDEAKANLEKSISLNPKNAKSYFDMGRLIQNSVADQEDNADETTRQNVLAPELVKAAGYYEKSFDIDDNQTALPGHIYRLYYSLNHSYNLSQYADKEKYWEALK